MSIIQTIISKFAKKSAPLSFYVGNGTFSSIIHKRDALDFYTSWIYACVGRRAQGMSGVEFKLYQMKANGEVEEIEQHELLDLLYRFNPEMTKFDFLELSSTYLDLYGSSPWLLSGGDKGRKPDNIFLLRPECLRAKTNKDGHVVAYEYQIGQFKKDYSKDEVLVLKNYNPRDPAKGLGVIEAVRLTAKNDDYIQQHNTALLENNARPGGYLVTDENLDDASYERIKKEFKNNHQGPNNAYKPMLLDAGLKFQPVTIPPKDLDFLESRRFNRDEIFSIFGVSKPIMGIYDDINRAAAKTAEYLFAKYTLEPMVQKRIEQLNEFLVTRYGDNLWLDFAPLAQEDDETEIKKRESAWNKWMTTNEIRALDGLDPVNGGDMIYMGMSQMPAMRNEGSKGLELKAAPSRPGRLDAKTQAYVRKRILNRDVRLKKMAEEATEKIMAEIERKTMPVFRIVEKKGLDLSDEQVDAFYKSRMNDEAALESLWQKTMAKFFEDQKGRFLEKMDSKKDAAADYGIDPKEELKASIEIISKLMYETLMKGTQQASELVGEPAVLDMDFLKSWLDKVSDETGQSITDTTIKAFEEAIKAGVDAGESLSELKARVEEVFEFAKGYRAEMIARTETARGVVEAHRKMYEHYGFTELKWLLSPGACEICQAKALGDWNVDNIAGELPVHPNCKCDVTPM